VLLLSLALFALILVLPAVPSIFEVVRPKDDGRLHIAEEYVRDPRWFGRSFREKLAPIVSEARSRFSGRSELHLRTDEEVHWSPVLRIPPLERLHGVGVGLRVVIGHDAGIRDAYALEELDVENGVVARTLISDRTMHVGSSVQILRWIDANGDIDVGAGSDLGLSARGGGRVTLGDRVRFERVWGAPVVSRSATTTPFKLDAGAATLVDADFVEAGTSVIIHGPVRVAAGTALPASLKVHGALTVESGASIAGNIIVRGNVTLASRVTVGGHIFAEGDIRLGPGTRISREGVTKTVYATGELLVANDVEIFGWVVTEGGGRTL
jgi:carbonic anhydrase/acetyltransferase-like protein (isoleucine patch superfamily)